MGLIAHLRSKQLHKSMIIPQHRLREKKHGPLFEQTRFLLVLSLMTIVPGSEEA